MCRKIKKEAWYTVPSLVEELEKTLDYNFLDLLVLVDTPTDLSNRVKKIGKTIESHSDKFVDELKPLLKTPTVNMAKELRMRFHPVLRAAERPRTTGFCKIKPFMRPECRLPRPKSVLQPVKSETWTMVTPVPHLHCPCHPIRTCDIKAVTKEDLKNTDMKITDIAFQLATAEEKRKRDLINSLEDYFYGFDIEQILRGEAELPQFPGKKRPTSVPMMPSLSRSGRKLAHGTSTFERVSTPRGRSRPQSQIHAAEWDASKQGPYSLEQVVSSKMAASKWARRIERKRRMQEKSHSYFFALLTMVTHDDV